MNRLFNLCLGLFLLLICLCAAASQIRPWPARVIAAPVVNDSALQYAARTATGNSVAVDAQGNAYIVSTTGTNGGDIQITKLNAAGTQQIYSATIGGVGFDQANGIAVDAAGNAYVTGATSSTDFPGAFPGAPMSTGAGVVFKTDDQATNWNASGRGLPARIIDKLIVDPTNPSIVYASAFLESEDILFPGRRDTVFKSVDGGQNWTPVRISGLNRLALLAVVPGNPSVVFMNTNDGLYRSSDGGATWSKEGLATGLNINLVFDHNNPLVLYAAVQGVIWKSVDGGRQFNRATDNGPPTTFLAAETELVIDRGAPATLYAIVSGAASARTLYKSTDGALSWQLMNLSFSDSRLRTLVIDPINSANLYAGTERGVYKSRDGGASWQFAGLENFWVTVITIDPLNPATVYAATPSLSNAGFAAGAVLGGVQRSVDGGMSWRAFESDLRALPVYALAIDPLNPSRLYAGTITYFEAFVLKLNPTGSSLLYATYAGAGGSNAIAIDAAGNACITGSTTLGPARFLNGFQTRAGSGFAAKLNAQGTSFTYATLLAGATRGQGARGNAIALDGTGKVCVTGLVVSDLPVKNGFQTAPGGGDYDGFVMKLDPEQAGEASLLYATYLGGANADEGQAIAVDGRGQVYVAGHTRSSNFPTTAAPLSPNQGTIFLARIDPTKAGAQSLAWSTYFGSGTVTDLAADAAGALYLTGTTRSPAFPVTPGALQINYGGGSCETVQTCIPPPPPPCFCGMPGCSPPRMPFPVPDSCDDAFLAKVEAAGSAVNYATYLGNSGTHERGNSIALDAAGNVYLTGAGNLPPTAGAFQQSDGNGFIAKLTLETRSTTVASVSAASFAGSQLAPESLAVAFLDAFGQGANNLRVQIRDSAGTEAAAAVLYSGPGQVNFQLPANLATGAAMVRVLNNSGVIASGTVEIATIAPGVFTANANGRGVAAAVAQRVTADNAQTYEPVARFDQTQSRFVTEPIDLGAATDQIFLVLFGTGWRGRSAESAVRVTIGGVDAPVTYASLQPTLPGVDQINVRLPHSLIGRGEVDVVVVVDGKTANTVSVSIK